MQIGWFTKSYISVLTNQPTVHSGGVRRGRVSSNGATLSSFDNGDSICMRQEIQLFCKGVELPHVGTVFWLYGKLLIVIYQGQLRI